MTLPAGVDYDAPDGQPTTLMFLIVAPDTKADVLPSCIIGSAIAGGLSAAFGCASPAPHGGAWATAVIGNPAMWIVACLVDSVVGCLILSLWKRPLPASESGLEK